MPHVVCRKSDGAVLSAARYDLLPFDPTTEVRVEVDEMPDRRTRRWDGDAGLRDATPTEIAAYDQARAQAQESAEFDGKKMLKAVAIWTAQKLGVPLATARAEILAVYRAL